MESQRLAALDILRLVAVVLVLGRHLWRTSAEAPASGFLAAWFRIGWIGVDLFFVLSGFLVSGLLFREYRSANELDLLRFFLRRGLKIYPAFYAMLLASIVGLALAGMPVPSNEVVSELLFVQNYSLGLWNHTWSLAVEEHFYLLLPLFLMILYQSTPGSDRFRYLPLTVLVLASVVLGLRVWTVLAARSTAQLLYPSHLRLDSLLFGVLLAYYAHQRRSMMRELFLRRWAPTGMVAVAFLCLAPVATLGLESPVTLTIGLTMLYLANGSILIVVLYWAPCVRLSTSKLGTVLAFIGAQSYSIYLWHMPVRSLVHSVGLPPPVELGAYLIGSLGVGMFMATVIESPILRIRDRWVPRQTVARVARVHAGFGPTA